MKMSLQVSPFSRRAPGSPLGPGSPFSPGCPLFPRLPGGPGEPALPGKPGGPGGPVKQIPLELLHRSTKALTGTMEYVISISISFSSLSRLCFGAPLWLLLLRSSAFSCLASPGSVRRNPVCSLQLCASACIWASSLTTSSVSSLCRNSRNTTPAELRSSSTHTPASSAFNARQTPLLSFMFQHCRLLRRCRVDLRSSAP